MRKRLTILSYVQFPSFVGLSYRIQGLTSALSKLGVECSVICPSDISDPSPQRIGLTRVEGIGIPSRFISRRNPFILRTLGILLFYVKSIPRILRRTHNRDVVIFEQIFSFPLMLIWKALRRRLIIDDMILLHLDKSGIKKWLSLALDLFVNGLADAVLTASPTGFEFMRVTYPKKTTYFLPNGCEKVDRKIAAKNLEKESVITAVLVGSLDFIQNQIAALNTLEIMRIVKERTNRLRVLLIGGPYVKAQELKLQTDDLDCVVHITGPLSANDLNKTYGEARVGLLPFFADTPLVGGSRTKALEYFAHGLLVISGEEGIGGLWGVRAGVHYLCANTILSFAEILLDVLRSPDKFETIRMSAYEYVSERFAWDSLAIGLADILALR